MPLNVFQRSIVSEAGDVLPLADVEVRDQDTAALVQLYSDYDGASPIGNPTAADADGFVRFYVATGRYRIEATSGALTRVWEDEVLGTSGSDIRYIRTTAEITASVTPVNYQYPEGVVDRYLTNTTPGTTDMTAGIVAALAVANAGLGKATLLAATYLTGNIDWPGNTLTLAGAASAYSYNTNQTPKTILRAKAGTTIILDLVQTGGAEDRTGNHIVDIDIDGNSIATYGVDMSGANILERCRVRRCTTANVRVGIWANSSHIVRCALNSGTGWGLHVHGVTTTTFSVDESLISLNTLGGILLEAGVLAKFTKCVAESNAGPGLRIYRPTAHTNAFSGIDFDQCWFEDNAATSPNFSLVIDSQDSGDSSKDPEKIRFFKCRFTCSTATKKYMNIVVANKVTFDDCIFNGSTQSDAFTLTNRAIMVAFLESGTNLISGGFTATQIDNAIAQGTRCYVSDRDVKRVVGAGAPAAAFANSWVNEGGGYQAARYWHDREGNVHLEGTIQTGTITTSAFTLPVGYRPALNYEFAVDSNGAYGLCIVASTGVVTPQVGNNARFSLNGISFPTG